MTQYYDQNDELNAGTGPQVTPPDYPSESGYGWDNTKIKDHRFNFLMNSYTGAGGYSDGRYLIPFKREIGINFSLRKKTTRYTNDFKSIIDSLTAPIFRADAIRKHNPDLTITENDAITLFTKNCDGAGTSYPQFMKKVARASRIYDSAFVIVENSPVSGFLTEADLKVRENLPYLILVTPDKIRDIAMTELGAVEMIKWVSFEPDIDTDGKNTEVEIITTWTPTYWRREVNAKVINQGENGLGYVPVFALYPEENFAPTLHPLPYGMASGLATINQNRFNLSSQINELSSNSAFPLLALIGNLDESQLDLGISNALKLPEGASAQYLDPDYSVLKELYELFKGMTQEMYNISGIAYLRNASQSSESRRQELERLYETLGDFRSQIQELDKKLMNTMADYLGIDIEYSVAYPNDFGVSTLDVDLQRFEAFNESDKVAPEVMGNLVKRIAFSTMSGMEDEEKQLLEDAITLHIQRQQGIIPIDE